MPVTLLEIGGPVVRYLGLMDGQGAFFSWRGKGANPAVNAKNKDKREIALGHIDCGHDGVILQNDVKLKHSNMQSRVGAPGSRPHLPPARIAAAMPPLHFLFTLAVRRTVRARKRAAWDSDWGGGRLRPT